MGRIGGGGNWGCINIGGKSGIGWDEDKLRTQYGRGAGDLRGEGVSPHVTDIGEKEAGMGVSSSELHREACTCTGEGKDAQLNNWSYRNALFGA